jgi:hypothetical protein
MATRCCTAGPFGAAWTRAGDDLQIDFVGAVDDLAQPGGGASSQCPFARTLRALAFFGGIKPEESDALALLVDHVAFKDINILGRNPTPSTLQPRQYTSSQGSTRPAKAVHVQPRLPARVAVRLIADHWVPRHCCKRAIPDDHNCL